MSKVQPPEPPSRPTATQEPFIHPWLGVSDEAGESSGVRPFILGWSVIIAFIAPLFIAWFFVGEDGPMWVLLAYIVGMLLVVLSMAAVVIGELIRTR